MVLNPHGTDIFFEPKPCYMYNGHSSFRLISFKFNGYARLFSEKPVSLIHQFVVRVPSYLHASLSNSFVAFHLFSSLHAKQTCRYGYNRHRCSHFSEHDKNIHICEQRIKMCLCKSMLLRKKGRLEPENRFFRKVTAVR